MSKKMPFFVCIGTHIPQQHKKYVVAISGSKRGGQHEVGPKIVLTKHSKSQKSKNYEKQKLIKVYIAHKRRKMSTFKPK